jgi:hypothetical protein
MAGIAQPAQQIEAPLLCQRLLPLLSIRIWIE